MTSPALRIEAVSVADSARLAPAWRNLAGRAEPNVFAEPAYLLPALTRLVRPGVRLVFVWKGAALIAVAALEPPRFPLGLARVWQSEQAALPAVLVDANEAAAALDALRAWVRDAFPWAAGLIVPSVERGSRLAGAAPGVAVADFARAALRLGAGAAADAESAKRRKEARRLERRLAERGPVELRCGADDDAIEGFLRLEAQGWKGARGTALASRTERVAFARDMLAAFAAEGRMKIFALFVADSPVAAGVLLRSGRRGFFWKTAYDERFADFSPGAALTRALGRRLTTDAHLDIVDSCAAPNHPMIDRLWADRLSFADLALDLGSPARFRTALAIERVLRRARASLKRLVLPFLGGKRW